MVNKIVERKVYTLPYINPTSTLINKPHIPRVHAFLYINPTLTVINKPHIPSLHALPYINHTSTPINRPHIPGVHHWRDDSAFSFAHAAFHVEVVAVQRGEGFEESLDLHW